MRRSRIAALLWLAAGLAFLVAGLVTDRRQPAFFAVATLFFAVSAITARRDRIGTR